MRYICSDGESGSMTGDRSASILIAVASKRSTTRKENYGYCQESSKEDREEGRQEAGEEAGEETREESTGEESRAEEGQEVGRQAQAERRVHEGDDAVEHARRRGRQHAAAAH